MNEESGMPTVKLKQASKARFGKDGTEDGGVIGKRTNDVTKH